MGIGVSLLLIAVGAVLTWAVTATANGIDVNTVGVILMVVGLAGLVLSLMFWSSWGGPRFARREAYVEGAAPVATRRSYVEDAPVERRTVVEDQPVATSRRRTVVEDDIA
jgi:hypothetical protein